MNIILGIVVFCVVFAASFLFYHQIRISGLIIGVIAGTLIGIVNHLVPTFQGSLGFLAPIAFIVMIAMTGYLMYWWRLEGSNFREMVPMIILAVLFFFTTKAAAIMTAALVSALFLVTLLWLIPRLVLITSIGYFVTSLFYYYHAQTGNRTHRVIARVTSGITTVALLFSLITGVYWKGLPEVMAQTFRTPAPEMYQVNEEEAIIDEANVEEETVPIVEEQLATTFQPRTIHTKYGDIQFTGKSTSYNSMLQMDDEPSNNFDFGPNPLFEGGTAENYTFEFFKRVANDAIFAAGVMAWYDAVAKTRFTGHFYDACKGEWADAMNMAKDEFINNPEIWYDTTCAFIALIQEQANHSMKMGYDLSDQMYQNPYTASGVADLIVMSTDQTGVFLVFGISIKGNLIEVAYRINCGFQPTNVQEVMHIVPDDTPRTINPPQPTPTPTKDPEPSGGNGDPKPQPDPPQPNPPQPDPPATPQKDPGKSPTVNTQPYDDPGPGSSTNNGAGATTSTADQPSNSNHGSNQDYNEAINDLKEVNQNQQTGSSSSTPSTPAPAPEVHIDNNADTGGGSNSAPINESTPVTPPATVADTGASISDNPGEAWGGPPD